MSQLKLKSFAITATATAAPLSATDLFVSGLTVQNIDSANVVWIGDSTVTAAAGFEIAKGGALGFDSLMTPTDKKREINLKDVYVICTSAQTATLRVAYTLELFT